MEEMSFEELFNNSVKDVKIGKTVTGTIIDINEKGEIFVDLGYKADGIIPRKEYSLNETADPKKELKKGDIITADVLKINDGLGNVLLSYKKAKQRADKKELEEKIKNKEIIEEPISEVLEKGFVVNYKGTRIFIPISLSGITREEQMDSYKGKIVKFKIIEYNPRQRKIIGSVKEVKQEEKEKELEAFWNEIEEGKEYTGTVTSMSSYGAFVSLGPVQGLLHISEITWARNAVPSEILSVGQEIKVMVKQLDKENRRIMLTYKEKGPDPWKKTEEKYHINDVVRVTITKLMPFGAFAELEQGIEGLIHISQICEKRIAKPEEELKIGTEVNAKIIEMDTENKKIELSMKELEGTSNEYRSDKVEEK